MNWRLWKKLLFSIGIVSLLTMLALIGWNIIANWPPSFAHADIAIQTADGRKIPYWVEIASTQQQQEYGLMYRRSMPEKTGMLFLFNPLFDPKDGVGFWMKNTEISLDMLFVRDDGTIFEVYPRAKPDDLTPIVPSEPARAAVEINGGEAESLNIKAGDKVVYPKLGAQ